MQEKSKYMHYTTIGLKKREKGTKPQAKTAVSYSKRPVCKHLLQGNTVFANTQYRSDFILYFIYISLAWEGIKTVKWNKGTPQGQRHLIGSRAVKQATEKLPKSERFYKLECDISRGIELTRCPTDFVLKKNFSSKKNQKKTNNSKHSVVHQTSQKKISASKYVSPPNVMLIDWWIQSPSTKLKMLLFQFCLFLFFSGSSISAIFPAYLEVYRHYHYGRMFSVRNASQMQKTNLKHGNGHVWKTLLGLARYS